MNTNIRKTKIVCTMGPASLKEDVLESMFKAGMNIARFNFSHGTHEYHKNGMELFRKVRNKLKLPAAVLLDTKGPEIRIGEFEDGSVELVNGQSFTFTTEKCSGSNERVSITYEKLPDEIDVGTRILIDDGRLELKVNAIEGKEIQCKVITMKLRATDLF